MTDQEPKHHGGRRTGAGRKPSLKPLSVLRLIDPQVRDQLADLTAFQREATGNPHLSQAQVVLRLIQAAHEQQIHEPQHQAATTSPAASSPAFEYADHQDDRPTAAHVAPGASAIAYIRREVSDILIIILRRKNGVGQAEGQRLIALLTELMPLYAAQIIPRAILEELDHTHVDDADRNQAVTLLLEQPLADSRQDGWERDLGVYAAQLATGPIQHQADRWALLTLAVEVSSATMVTNDRIADLTTRLLAKGIEPTRWLTLAAQRPEPMEKPLEPAQ